MGDLPVQQDEDNRPGNAPSAVHGWAWIKNRENNPMQRKADPARGARAAMLPGKENAPSSRPQPNFIRSRRGDAAGLVVPAALLSPCSMD
jgi:hypothetical protein